MKKKIYQKTWFIIVLLILFFPVGLFLMWKYADWKKVVKIIVTILIGLCVMYSVFIPAPEPSTTKSQATQATQSKDENKKAEKKSAKEQINALKGKSVLEAEQTLSSLEYEAVYTFETTGMDYTGEVAAMEADQQSRVIVTEVGEIHKSKKTVDLTIISKEKLEQKNKESALRKTLSESSSCVAINDYGKSQYTYGFKFSTVSAVFTLYDDNTWSVSSTCKVTNAYGTEAKMECIARVTGTSDNPQVVYFEVR